MEGTGKSMVPSAVGMDEAIVDKNTMTVFWQEGREDLNLEE